MNSKWQIDTYKREDQVLGYRSIIRIVVMKDGVIDFSCGDQPYASDSVCTDTFSSETLCLEKTLQLLGDFERETLMRAERILNALIN